MIHRDPVIDVESTVDPFIRYHQERNRGCHDLIRDLNGRSHRYRGATTHKEGQGVERRIGRMGPAALQNPSGPPLVPPARRREVNLPVRSAAVEHGSYEQIGTDQKLRFRSLRVETAAIRGKLHKERPHERNPAAAGFPERGVEIGKEPITELQIAACNPLHLFTELPELLGGSPRSSVVP